MDSQPKSMHIPRATIRRLATYVQVLENLAREGTEIISSNPLAEACGVNGSQIRKDLAYFGEFGIRGVGYNVTSLMAAITSALDVETEKKLLENLKQHFSHSTIIFVTHRLAVVDFTSDVLRMTRQ